MNTKFATVDNDNRIVYAPDTLGASLRAPKDWQYHAANYWEIDKTVPTAPEGKYAKPVVIGGYNIGDLVTIQEEHVPETDENGEPLDPNDEYKPLLKVVRRRYEFLPIPEHVKAPRTFSKLKLELALFKFGLLDKLYAFLDANTISNDFGQTITLRHAYDIANELTEGHELFKPYLAMAQSALGVDDGTVERILSASVMED